MAFYVLAQYFIFYSWWNTIENKNIPKESFG